MKTYSFYYDTMNWFMPFYPEHPDLGTAADLWDRSRFVRELLKSGPFCDSDKYSFMLAFNQVLQRLTPNLREMFENGESYIDKFGVEGRDSGLYLRRMYLQNLYRFFRLCPQRKDFRNIFTGGTVGLALLTWRFFTYYIALFVGVLTLLLEKLTRKRSGGSASQDNPPGTAAG